MNLSKQERLVLAAIFSGTNLGLDKPKRPLVQDMLQNLDAHNKHQIVLSNLVYSFWSGYMEDNAMERAFMGESKMWYKELGKETRESVTRIWPDHAALIWEEEKL